MKPRDLKTMAIALQELGQSYDETLEIMKEIADNSHQTKNLWRDGYKSRLVRIGLTLITFPEPTPLSETIGAFVLSLGLIQNQMKRSTLHIEDVYDTFRDVNRSLLRTRQELT